MLRVLLLVVVTGVVCGTPTTSPRAMGTETSSGESETTTIGMAGETRSNSLLNHSIIELGKSEVIVISGICGPDGCLVEEDVYGSVEPLAHTDNSTRPKA